MAWKCLPFQGQWSRVQSCLPTQGGFLRFPGLPFPAHTMQEAEQPPPPPTPPFSMVLRVFRIPATLFCPGCLPLDAGNWGLSPGRTPQWSCTRPLGDVGSQGKNGGAVLPRDSGQSMQGVMLGCPPVFPTLLSVHLIQGKLTASPGTRDSGLSQSW